MADNLRVLIIGGVACGPKTACRLRRLRPDAEITVLERGKDISYGACGMPYFIQGTPERIEALSETPIGVMRNTGFFKAVKGIDVQCGKEAVAIDREKKEVLVRDVETGKEAPMAYDKLVLATGAEPTRPPIPGIDADGVQHFHSLRDADRLDRLLKERQPKNVAIVGAGLIGLEMAEALRAKGLNVTLIEMFNYIMPTLLDEEVGRLAGKHLVQKGVNLATGSAVKEFITNGEGRLAQVKTDKDTFPADLAIVAIGVQPTSELAAKADLALAPNHGIIINEYCQTSDPDIYAGGDCVVTPYVQPVLGKPLFSPQGSTSNKEGRIIANHIAGMAESFPGVLGTVICKAFDFTIGRTGLTENWARALNLDVETVLCPGPDRPHYMPGSAPIVIKLVVNRKNRKVLGCQIVGPGDAAKRLDVMVTALSFGATLDQIAHLDLAYAPPYSPPIDPLLTAVHVLQNKMDGVANGISPIKAKEKIEKKEVFLIDVRSPKEFEEVRLPYEVEHIPLGALREKARSLPRDKEILAFCKVSMRGYEAQRILQGAGIDSVSFIEGGIAGWPFALETSK
ncbi:MAG: FAD-dependent oxidoreductase [Planctomycetota bacterium]|jgi:NADPH-dependent 2,4-dienoyl-CoA reductase/sulfur reductase-like enzyme/rhodanese-related sulfurtransferase